MCGRRLRQAAHSPKCWLSGVGRLKFRGSTLRPNKLHLPARDTPRKSRSFVKPMPWHFHSPIVGLMPPPWRWSFFVPEPAKGVAEMARVVRPGGAVAAYAWDMLGGGFPMTPILSEVRALGKETVGPPSAEASRMESLRELWGNAGTWKRWRRARLRCSGRLRISMTSGRQVPVPGLSVQRSTRCLVTKWKR